jgi:hypothetical protein
MESTYPIRLDSNHKRLSKRAPRKKAKTEKKKASCLNYPDLQVDPGEETNPNEFLQRKIRDKMSI